MNPNILLAHSHLNHGLSSLVSAQDHTNKDRPLKEVLYLLDQATIALHDAKAEVVKARADLYAKWVEQETSELTTEAVI